MSQKGARTGTRAILMTAMIVPKKRQSRMDVMMTSTVKGRAEISRGNTPMKKEGSKVSMESFLYKTSGTGSVTLLPFSACAGERRGSAPLSDERRILSDVLLPR